MASGNKASYYAMPSPSGTQDDDYSQITLALHDASKDSSPYEAVQPGSPEKKVDPEEQVTQAFADRLDKMTDDDNNPLPKFSSDSTEVLYQMFDSSTPYVDFDTGYMKTTNRITHRGAVSLDTGKSTYHTVATLYKYLPGNPKTAICYSKTYNAFIVMRSETQPNRIYPIAFFPCKPKSELYGQMLAVITFATGKWKSVKSADPKRVRTKAVKTHKTGAKAGQPKLQSGKLQFKGAYGSLSIESAQGLD